MSYFTIKDFGKFEFEEKKSLFIGSTKRVESEKDAREFIDKIKHENKEARHNVYAYIIGEKNEIQRYSDDGEPQGTGGIPVLEVIKKNSLSDIVVVVTRYFGGILLGTGGLTRAYTKSAAEAIKEAEIVEKVKGCTISFNFDYDLLGKIQYHFEQQNIHIENINYTDKVEVSIFSEIHKVESIINSINEITSARCIIEVFDEQIYFKSENRLYKIIV